MRRSIALGATTMAGVLGIGPILADLLSETTFKSIEPESAAVTNAQIEAFNKRFGTDVKPGITAIPFQNQ